MCALRVANAIDLHCHAGPDTVGGDLNVVDTHSVNGVTAARDALASGHAAVVLKSHSFASVQLAENLEDAVPGIRVFGGICTDNPSGGLCIDAVEAALGMGAKIVWLPTVHSIQDFDRLKVAMPAKNWRGHGIRVIDDNGQPLPVVKEIFDLVQQKDAVLATGHTTADEHYAICRAYARRAKVLVTHAGEEKAGPRLTAAQSAELADLGAVVELTAQTCKDQYTKDPKKLVEMIREIGPERCTLSSDYGWYSHHPHPAPGLNEFYETLWNTGITEAELQIVGSTNPGRLLNLDFAS